MDGRVEIPWISRLGPAGRVVYALVLCGCASGTPGKGGHEASSADGRDVARRALSPKEIAPSIHVVGQSDPLTYPVEGNVTIIVNDADIVVVDTGRTPRSARTLIDAIRRISSKPVSVVVNTHWHGDHHHGNAEFVRAFPRVDVIAHAAAREEIETLGRRSLAAQIRTQSDRAAVVEAVESGRAPDGRVLSDATRYRLRRLTELPSSFLAELHEVVITPPTATFERELVMYRGQRRIVVSHGGPGNTRGDAVVHLPGEGIVITGDLLVATVPFMSASFPAEWLERLREIRALSPRIIVPGHGPVQRDWWFLDTHIELLEYVVGHVRRGIAEGRSLAELERSADLSAFRRRYARGDSIVGLEFDVRVGQTVVPSAYNELVSNGRHP